jgi:heme oxygenase
MLANLYFVYVSLEEAMEKNKDNEFIKPIYFPELNRTESLKEDLSFYYGDDWMNNLKPSEATQSYINRILQVSEKRPDLLVGHAYTRYLGDLSGGQILKKIAQRAMNLQSTKGLSFYEFRSIDDELQFKQKYKDALDSLPVTSDISTQIVAEANVAFNLNMKLFQELETSFTRIIIRIVLNYLNSFLLRFQGSVTDNR